MVLCGIDSESDSVSEGPTATIFWLKVIGFIVVSGYGGNDEKWSL
jgi:hypothetical protein